jgi:hypothetical protein
MLRSRLFLMLTLPGAALACSDSTAPTLDDVAGSYTAEQFTTEEGGVVTDQLAGGASLNLVLASDGSTTGRLFVPGGDEGGGDFDADLVGTWSLDGATVTLDHEADTFLRDMPFTFSSGRLSGEATFSGVTIVVVLRK